MSAAAPAISSAPDGALGAPGALGASAVLGARGVLEGVFALGLGRSGLSVARAALRAGARPRGWDDDPAARARALAEAPGLALVDPALPSALEGARALAWSPGAPDTGPDAHPLAAAARARGLEPVSDVELLLRARPPLRVAAFTGTDGKSTTCALAAAILERGGAAAVPCGNFGTPAFDAAEEALERARRAPGAAPVLALEMSSFQLPLTPSLAPEVAVLTSLAPDHLDRHGSLENYLAAKRLVFRGAGVAVVGVDDALSAAERARLEGASGAPGARVVPVSGREAPEGGVGPRDGFLCDARGPAAPLPESGPLATPHGRLAAAAAWAAASALGAPRAALAPALAAFRGLPHRFREVARARGVSFVDDSKATTAHAAAAALAAPGALFWIAGGRGKGQDLAALLSPRPPGLRAAFLIGESAPELLAAARAAGVPARVFDSLAGAFEAAADAAEAHAADAGEAHAADEGEDGAPGDAPGGASGAVVLLSPACSSLDGFSGFAERGDAFAALARARARVDGAEGEGAR